MQIFCFQVIGTNTQIITYQVFIAMLKDILQGTSFTTWDYVTHSFPYGVAFFALEPGIPHSVIFVPGDWCSDTVYLFFQFVFVPICFFTAYNGITYIQFTLKTPCTFALLTFTIKVPQKILTFILQHVGGSNEISPFTHF